MAHATACCASQDAVLVYYRRGDYPDGVWGSPQTIPLRPSKADLAWEDFQAARSLRAQRSPYQAMLDGADARVAVTR